MLATLRKRYEREDEGFTLIELMVVVLIIAILLAIAIPTFLGARDRANNRAAQSSLRNALTAAKTLYTDSQDFAAADTSSELETVEPSLEYVTTDSTDYKEVSIAASGAHQWAGAALSKTNTCYWIREVAVASGTTDAGTYFGSGAATACAGTDALGATGAEFP
jgi:type IV pilus assembly protein PilA